MRWCMVRSCVGIAVRLVRSASVLMLVLACVSLSHAQQSPAGMMSRPVPAAALPRLVDTLGLDADQATQLKVLYRGYIAARRDSLGVANADFRDLQVSMDRDTPEEEFADRSRDHVTKTVKTLAEGRSTFEADVRAMLTAEQADRWDVAMRALRRADAARFGVMAGSMADVTELVRAAGIAREGDIPSILDRYEGDIDGPIQAWNRSVEQTLLTMRVEARREDFGERTAKVLQAMFERSRAVRDINRRAVREVEDHLRGLSEPHIARADAMRAAFLAASYPTVYGQREIDQVFQALKPELDAAPDEALTLSEEQHREIAATRHTYLQDVALANEALARAIDVEQERFLHDIQALVASKPQYGPDSALGQARARRDAIAGRAMDRLRAIVGADALQPVIDGADADVGNARNDVIGGFDDFEEDEDDLP